MPPEENIDLTVIMINNGIYGMTGGQVAPTTPLQGRTQTSPYGNLEPPFDVCELARSARGHLRGPMDRGPSRSTPQNYKRGHGTSGICFIEVMAQCPTQRGRYIEGTSNAAELLNLLKKRSVSLDKLRRLRPKRWAGNM